MLDPYRPVAGAPSIRPRGTVITDEVLASWPATARRVERRLRAVGADRANAEDLAAEAIARALDHRVEFQSAEHLYAWTLRVARNLFVDQCRAVGRGPAVRPIEDYDAVPLPDTATVVEHRMSLERVLQLLATFSPADRAAVLDDTETPVERREAVRLNVRRHRARLRLRAALASFLPLFRVSRRALKGGLVVAPAAFASLVVALALVPGHRTPAAPAEAAAPAVRTLPARPVVSHDVPRSPAARAARSRPAPRHRPVASGRPRRNTLTRTPAGPAGGDVWARPRQPGDHVLCLRDVLGSQQICLGVAV